MRTNHLARAAMLLLLAVLGSIGAWAETNVAGGGISNKIVVVSDIHVMAPELLEEGAETQEAWTTYYAGQRKMLQQSAAIFDQFIDQMIALQPKVLLVTGDLTKDGEQASHQYVKDGLERLSWNDVKVLVIPGNHDFGAEGNNTLFKADGTTEEVDVMTTDNFANFYAGYGYGEYGAEYDENSLSYVVEPVEGLVVLGIDSHRASISEETLTWLCTKAKDARNAGKQVIAMMHHPLFPHITGADMFIDTYTVTKDGGTYEDVRNALIEAGVNTILTGHFHTSDIAKDWNDDAEKNVYDVNTGSLISYPCDYRILTPSQDFMTLDVATASIVPTGMTADECKTWLKDRMTGLAKGKLTSYSEPIKSVMAGLVADAYIIHAEGDEQNSTSDTRATILAAAENYPTYAATFHSMLEDKSNYGTTKENQTNDRTLSISLPEVGPFISSEPAMVTIGNNNYTSEVPLSASHAWVLSKQMYTAKEINHKGKIWSLAFNTTKGDLTRNLTVYIAQTSSSYASWDVVTEENRVFSGEVKFNAWQWNTIYFDKPFEYDGKSNIVVIVDDNTGKKSGSWGVLTHHIFYGESGYSGCSILSDDTKDIDPLDGESISSASSSNSYDYKNDIKFTFGEYPLPADFTVSDIGDISAKMECSLRGDATAWNVRYRKVAAEGEEEQEWTVVSGITESSSLISGLTAATKYEAQVQGAFAEDDNGWTESVTFTTACCPVEEQADIIYAVNSNYSSWYGYAIQFVDITDENNPVEVAYINPVDYSFTGGKLTLCCGHKYKVNWIYDEEHSNVNGSFSLALFFEPGDKFFSMARGTAPEETAELTTFVMDCTTYCTQMPQILNESGTTYNSATITFLSQTKTGQVVYSTEADFDPEKATPEDMDFEEVPQSEVPWDQPNASITLKGLQPLTAYYVRVRSVCTAEPIGVSRWSDPVKVTTGSRYDAPTQVIAEPVNSRTEKLSWSSRGNEKSHNLYYRKQAAGNPVDPSAIQTFGGGKGTGFKSGSWGEGIQSSYGDHPFSNTLFVEGIPAGSSFSFKAGNGKSGAGQTKFFYGMQKLENGTPLEQMKKFDKKCLNDADRAAIIKELQNKIKELTDEQQIAAYNAEIEELNSLPTDAQKLEDMKTLEQKIKENNVAKAELTLKFVNGEITNEQYESEIYRLEVQNTMFKDKLSELRAITTNAEDHQNNGFSITKKKESPNARTRGTDDDTYIFFIRHSDPNGVLLVTDLTITPPEQVGEWTVIKNISKTEYTLTGLEPGTAYEVMVEPIYEDGTTGTQSPITIFTTIGAETDPSEGVFSVAKDKKVQFAKGNLRYEGDTEGYEAEWSMAKQQYEVLGEANIDAGAYESTPAYLKDLLCWSTTNNYYGVSNYYWRDDDVAAQYFQGDFVDWGENPALIANLGEGWSTLSKDEWTYLLTERENAAKLQSFATISYLKGEEEDKENKESVSVKGLILLPDDWTGDAPVATYTAETWKTLEAAGAVFLPVTGHLWSYDDGGYTKTEINGIDVIGNYWTSTPSTEDNLSALALNFNLNDSGVTSGVDMGRRYGCAVRLVKTLPEGVKGDANGDGIVNAVDIVEMVNAKNGKPSANFKLKNVDFDGDGNISDAEINAVADIILGKAQ